MNKTTKKIDWKIVLIWLFPVLFLIDDILGLNGYQFTVGGIGIRILLFCITTVVLFSYCLLVAYKEKMSIFKRKTGEKFFFDYIKPLDYIVAGFLCLNFVWATVVPMVVRGETSFGIKDFSTILVLILYFPIVFLMRTGRIEYKKFEKIIYFLLILLAFWHSVMYIGETIHTGFYESYYDFIDIISFGTAVRTDVVLGFGITRIVQVTSPMLLLGGALSAKYVVKGKYWNLIPLAVFLYAICITYTKSIWLGYATGIAIYLIGSLFVRSNKTHKYRLASVICFMISVTVALNYVAFNNTIFQRLINSAPSANSTTEMQKVQDLYEKLNEINEHDSDGDELNEDSQKEKEKLLSEIKEKENAIKDIEGTKSANEQRQKQTGALLNKWKQSKWVGFGYGAYAEDCIRNETAPYMYESVFPAMMMKLGLVGLIPWVILIIAAIVTAVTNFWKKDKKTLLWWVGMSVAFGMAVQTNPFLFTFSGFSMILFILTFINTNSEIECEEKSDM
ncbi:MAG: O-antigen ligase family protein [Clostridia bacterium]|nr:O-antigen ligase family protein [Clostridia bacterium]